MTDYPAWFEKLQIQARELFRQTTFEEFFGNQVFETHEQDYYLFAPEEKGDAVWIIERHSENQDYEVLEVKEANKFPPNPTVPRPCSFDHCEIIDDTWLEDRRVKEIEARLKQGGKLLGQKANKAFIDVLMASISNRLEVKDEALDEILADTFSKSVSDGYRPDIFLFPEHLEAKLVQQGIIIRDNASQHTHYVGKTISGQRGYWASELPHDTALMLDSSVGMLLAREPRFEIVRIRAFTPGVCGYLRLNPIVKNTKGILAFTNIEQGLAVRTKRSTPAIQAQNTIPYIDSGRISELRAIVSTQFDLARLIQLCDEINTCYTYGCYLAVIMLIRALLDHVPPIFGYNTFVEVANNYGGKSIKQSLQNLQNSSRNIADAYLHLPIRAKESLPNRTQVYFANDLDVLLAEIVRLLK